MKQNLICSLALVLMGCTAFANAEVVYSQQSIGNTSITTAGGTTVISGPTGTTVINNNADQFSGTWTNGMDVTLSRLVAHEHIPSKIIVGSMSIKMNDGEEMSVLALTAEESGKTREERSTAIWNRANRICELSETHKYALEVVTKEKWISGLLIDLTQKSQSATYSTYRASSIFSGAKYFSKIVCGLSPRQY